MTSIRQSTWTAAVAGRHPPSRPRHERFLQMFVRIEADEGRCLLLFFGYAFLVLERAALPRARRSLVTQSRGKQMLGPVSLRLGIAPRRERFDSPK